MTGRMSSALLLAAVLLSATGCASDMSSLDEVPFAIGVVSFVPGENAGFGQDRMPDVVLGPPRGAGEGMGSVDVLSLGRGGSIVVELGAAVVDGPGPDFMVFENAFRFGGGVLFAEPGAVSISEDGERFLPFPCHAEAPTYSGCAGVTPVAANDQTNDIDPTDPQQAGGDAFDLEDLGVSWARYVKIVDMGPDRSFGGEGTSGFDLDAIVSIHTGR